MNNMLKQLDTIKNVGTRLRDLANSRAVPDNIAEALQNDYESIKWAHEELKSLHIVDMTVLICKGRIEGIDKIVDAYDQTDNVVWPCAKILVKPDTVSLEFLREKFNYEDKEAPQHGKLDWLICKKYYIRPQAAMFDCFLLKKWLDEVGLRKARSEIYGWAIKYLATLQ